MLDRIEMIAYTRRCRRRSYRLVDGNQRCSLQRRRVSFVSHKAVAERVRLREENKKGGLTEIALRISTSGMRILRNRSSTSRGLARRRSRDALGTVVTKSIIAF